MIDWLVLMENRALDCFCFQCLIWINGLTVYFVFTSVLIYCDACKINPGRGNSPLWPRRWGVSPLQKGLQFFQNGSGSRDIPVTSQFLTKPLQKLSSLERVNEQNPRSKEEQRQLFLKVIFCHWTMTEVICWMNLCCCSDRTGQRETLQN